MPLIECKLCGRVYTEGGRMGVCPRCLRRLGDLYAEVHEYMRDHDDEEFDINSLAEAMGASIADIKALVDLGYISRDLKGYDQDEEERRKLAQALTDEMSKIGGRHKLTTYGGDIYSRGYGRSGR